MNRQRFSVVAAIALAIALVWSLSSCSSNSNPTSSGGNGTPPSANSVNISGFAFTPASLTVKVGVKVTWTNKDAATHTVTSDNGAFTSSGNLGAGESYVFTFTAVGTYPYHCAVHPAMKGTVVVTP